VNSPRIVVGGVSGVGKTTIAQALAARLGAQFIDADELHPAANVRKMSAGIPLDDEDRAPWLDVVGRALASSTGVVVACSALRRRYRDRLRRWAPDAVIVQLVADRELLGARMMNRSGHFMPASLLDSQLELLEVLEREERGCVVDAGDPVELIVDRIMRCL
jgi:carbohydrate kinase (thermoresistant glucokinase family)